MSELILNESEARHIVNAMAFLNDISVSETEIVIFHGNKKIRVAFYGNRVNIDMFGNFGKDDRSERYYDQYQFQMAYGLV